MRCIVFKRTDVVILKDQFSLMLQCDLALLLRRWENYWGSLPRSASDEHVQHALQLSFNKHMFEVNLSVDPNCRTQDCIKRVWEWRQENAYKCGLDIALHIFYSYITCLSPIRKCKFGYQVYSVHSMLLKLVIQLEMRVVVSKLVFLYEPFL